MARRFETQLARVESIYGGEAPKAPEAVEAAPAPSEPSGDDGFDPADYKVEDVIAYAEQHPDEVEAIINAELEGKGRVTIIEALTGEADTDAD